MPARPTAPRTSAALTAAAAHYVGGGPGWATLDLGAARAGDVWRVLAQA